MPEICLSDALHHLATQPFNWSVCISADKVIQQLFLQKNWQVIPLHVGLPPDRNLLAGIPAVVRACTLVVVTLKTVKDVILGVDPVGANSVIVALEKRQYESSFLNGMLLGLARGAVRPCLIVTDGPPDSLVTVAGANALAYGQSDVQAFLDYLDIKGGIADRTSRCKAALSMLRTTRTGGL